MINFEQNGSCDQKNVITQIYQSLYYLISALDPVPTPTPAATIATIPNGTIAPTPIPNGTPTPKKKRKSPAPALFNIHGEEIIQPPFKCEECGKIFKFRENLKRHVRNDNAHKRKLSKAELTCQYCNKEFDFISRLKLHLKDKHENRRDFACTQCHKAFNREKILKDHIRTVHEKIKKAGKFPCDQCEFVSTTTWKLKRHKASKHDGTRDYQCIHCPKAFR